MASETVVESPEEVCGLCLQALAHDDVAVKIVDTFACTHKFHDYCLHEYRDALGIAPADLKCPLCKAEKDADPGEAIVKEEPGLTETIPWSDNIASPNLVPPSSGAEHDKPQTPDPLAAEPSVGVGSPTPIEVSSAIVPMGAPDPPSPAVSVQSLRAMAEIAQGIPIGCCFFCTQEVMPNQGKIIAHQPVKIQCLKCRRVDQCVANSDGSIQWLRDIPFDEAQTFYRDAHELKPAQIADLCRSGRIFKTTHTIENVVGGEYLPLSVWETRGFDVSAIEANSLDGDKKFHSQLGWVYRVMIESKTTKRVQSKEVFLKIVQDKRRRLSRQGSNQSISGSIPIEDSQVPPGSMPGSSTGNAAASVAAAKTPASPKAKNKKKGKQSSSSNTSSKSSASYGAAADEEAAEAHKEEQAESFGDRKQRLKAEKEAARKAACEARAQKRVADKQRKALKDKAKKIEKKLCAALSGMRKTIANPNILEVPACVVGPVKEFVRTFGDALQEALDIINDINDVWDPKLDTVPFKPAQDAEKVLVAILFQLNKASNLAKR